MTAQELFWLIQEIVEKQSQCNSEHQVINSATVAQLIMEEVHEYCDSLRITIAVLRKCCVDESKQF
jgi:hypothetical protein